MKSFAITGLGLVSSIGVGYDAFRDALRSAEGINTFEGHPTHLDPQKVQDPIAAECHTFDAKTYLGDKGLRNFDRLTKLLIVSAKLALDHSGLKVNGTHQIAPDRIGVCSATAYGSLEAITEAVEVTELRIRGS